MSSLVGKMLGQNYRIVEPIGAGAMGVVYVVEHVTLKKRFAAKLLTADLARHPEAVARFEVEAHAASQLDHENIVSVIDYGKTEDGGVFLIMELLRGKTLQARMDQGQPSAEETVAIIMQVCRALAAAHAAGIVHRDMKPENVFLTQRPGGRPMVKVLDFGISKARESSLREGRITKQGQLLGSPEYMSPEASRGDEVDARADVYAVGIMLYELLCGDVPFRHENYLKVLQMHAGLAPRPPRELAPGLPEAVERLIMRALEKDPRRRHSSIEELEAELLVALPEVAQRALIQSQTPPHGQWLATSTQPLLYVSGTNPGLAEGSLTAYAPAYPDGVATTLVTRPRGRQRVTFLLWCGVVVAAGAAVALLVSKRTGSPPDEAAPGQSASAQKSRPAAEDPGARPVVESAAPTGPSDRAARPGEIRLRIATTPSGASATLEGKELGRTPLDVWVASADREGDVELELRGYRSVTRSVPLDHDAEIDLSLHREQRRPSSSSRRGSGNGGTSRSNKSASSKGTGRSSDGDERADRPAADLDIKEGR